jgi:mannose-6-phosphate isomerase-like protein (cupin superfamily)
MVFMEKTLEEIESKGFKVVDKDFERPWGGFLVIDESQAQNFSNSFFNGIDVSDLKISGKLSPKILMVKSKSRLSWQYHFRREEIWSVYRGTVGVVVSDTDFEKEMIQLRQGDQIKLKKEQRHRLIGLDDWAVIAEIWQHTEKDNPSDEDDIVRINDDYGR